MRPAFSRSATHRWFIIAVIGIIMKTDSYGVTSIVRALQLDQCFYTSLIHFFHSSAFNLDAVLKNWWDFLEKQNMFRKVNDRIVMIGDHTSKTKEGKKIPACVSIRQTSETSSKPNYFRGHFWGCISALQCSGKKIFATPLVMKIVQGMNPVSKSDTTNNSLTSVLQMASNFVNHTGLKAYITLDAYFASKNSFKTALMNVCKSTGEFLLHIIVRAKKNVVAYEDPPVKIEGQKGRNRKYGVKLILMNLFETCADKFTSEEIILYGKKEMVKYYALNLIWKPIKSKVRFVLATSSQGNIILMSSDLALNPINIIELYSCRVYIESMFNTFKNVIQGFIYHFWSSFLPIIKRVPAKINNAYISNSSNVEKTTITFDAILKFVTCSFIAQGLLQIIAVKFKNEIIEKSFCWLRTQKNEIPSEFVTKAGFSNIINNSFRYFRENTIINLITNMQSKNCIFSFLNKIS